MTCKSSNCKLNQQKSQIVSFYVQKQLVTTTGLLKSWVICDWALQYQEELHVSTKHTSYVYLYISMYITVKNGKKRKKRKCNGLLRDEPMALSLYLQQTTQRRHTPGLPATCGNTQTQVTERQTEDNGIMHKYSKHLWQTKLGLKNEKTWPLMSGDPVLLCEHRLTI